MRKELRKEELLPFEIDLLVNANGIGIVSLLSKEETVWDVTMYQDRLITSLPDDQAFENLSEGKAYWAYEPSFNAALKAGLDFWFIKMPEDMKEYEVYYCASYKEAAEYLIKENLPYILMVNESFIKA